MKSKKVITAISGVRKECMILEEKTIRLLRADEIECRVAVINEKGLSLLLFKDARVDQRILDETFTPFGWRRTHQSIDGNLYCTVEVWDTEKQQWIAKQDVGTMSYAEKEKGQASDSFKRACFNWGIGRELYTAPFIWIRADKVEIQRKGERFTTNEHFTVQTISYNENREIDELEIRDSKGKIVFALRDGSGKSVEDVKSALNMKASGQPKNGISDRSSGGRHSEMPDGLPVELQRELNRTGVALETVLKRYHLTDISQMTPEIYGKAILSLKNSKTKVA